MPRIRELDVYEGVLPCGAHNAITDVTGVAVGHFTLIQGEGTWTGNGPFRTGVTLILPHTGNLYEEKAPAAVHTINGFGKVAGFQQVRELGNVETPIALTGTLNVPRVADALITLTIENNPYVGQSNFGRPEELTVAGVPIGHNLQPPNYRPRPEAGSIMIVLATDAPLDSRQMGRLCRRAAFGLARTGSTCHGGSGDFVIAFSTAYRIHDRPADLLVQRPVLYEQPIMSALALAVIESVEEAIYNSLLMAHTVVGRDGNTRYGLQPIR